MTRTLTGKQYTITAGDQQATVVEVGAGLRRYTKGGVDVSRSYPADELPPKACGNVLVPWPNRIRGGRYRFDGVDHQLPLTEPAHGNASHGLGRWARWTAARLEESVVTMVLDIVPQTGWPFEVAVAVQYELHADTGLQVSIEARNHGAGPAPFGAGFHPYLSLAGVPLDDITLTVPGSERLLVDDALIPVDVQPVDGTPYDFRQGRRLGATRLDDAFTALSYDNGRGAAELRAGDSGARLWFDESFRYLQVFTVDDVGDGAPGLAVEPMTCPADAFNSGQGLLTLEPGTEWRGTWGIQQL